MCACSWSDVGALRRLAVVCMAALPIAACFHPGNIGRGGRFVTQWNMAVGTRFTWLSLSRDSWDWFGIESEGCRIEGLGTFRVRNRDLSVEYREDQPGGGGGAIFDDDQGGFYTTTAGIASGHPREVLLYTDRHGATTEVLAAPDHGEMHSLCIVLADRTTPPANRGWAIFVLKGAGQPQESSSIVRAPLGPGSEPTRRLAWPAGVTHLWGLSAQDENTVWLVARRLDLSRRDWLFRTFRGDLHRGEWNSSVEGAFRAIDRKGTLLGRADPLTPGDGSLLLISPDGSRRVVGGEAEDHVIFDTGMWWSWEDGRIVFRPLQSGPAPRSLDRPVTRGHERVGECPPHSAGGGWARSRCREGRYRSASEFLREAIDRRVAEIDAEALAAEVERYCDAGHAGEDDDLIAGQAFDEGP